MVNRKPAKDKAQLKARAEADLDRRYASARKHYLRIAKGKTDRDFYPALSPATLKRIRDGKDEIDPINKERLIELMGAGGISSRLYHSLASLIGQSRSRKELGDILTGTYRYFRQDNPTPDGAPDLSEGKIEIFLDGNGDIAFRHWPPEFDENGDPEHNGYAFLVDSKLYMLAWKPGVLRLGIAHCSDDCDGVMNGYVLSVRTVGGNHPIFSAPSVLVSETKTDELEKFRAKDGSKHFSKHHPGHLPDYHST